MPLGQSDIGLRRPLVVVDPAEAWAARRRLFTALGAALGAEFVPAGDGPPPVDAVGAIVFGDRRAEPGLPAIVLPESSSAGAPRGAAEPVVFAAAAGLDAAISGASLAHDGLPLTELGEAQVLAVIGRAPVWTREGNIERVAVGIGNLEPAELLRSRLSVRRFLPLLPVVHFVRRLIGDTDAAPVRAAFMFDDPNLHATSYGYLDYRRVAAEGRRVGYHVALAAIPLDMWYSSRSAVRLFREHADVLSLLVHGNDHVRRELARPAAPVDAWTLLTHATARVERFERRTGLSVARVMAPPHGACSEQLARELPAFGFDALCVSRPYPWRTEPPREDVLATWHQTDVVADGLPVLPRMPFQSTDDEIRLRAFLRQPIILYGHHGDMRDGLELLEADAGRVAKAGEVSWLPLDDIVASSYELRVEKGGRGQVVVHTRRVLIRVPPGVSELVFDARAATGVDRVLVDGMPLGEAALQVTPGAMMEIRIVRAQPEVSTAWKRPRLVPLLRRGVTEVRDRLQPIVAPTRI